MITTRCVVHIYDMSVYMCIPLCAFCFLLRSICWRKPQLFTAVEYQLLYHMNVQYILPPHLLYIIVTHHVGGRNYARFGLIKRIQTYTMDLNRGNVHHPPKVQ